MCDPVTLTVAATVATMAGQGYSAISANQQHRYQASVATNNAALAKGQAADAVERGNRASLVKWREIAQQRSGQIAAAAANGLDTGFGSAADAVSDTMRFGTEDVRLIQEGAAREATGFQISAQNYREESKAQKRAGTNALIAGAFEMTGTALGGAGQIKGVQAPAKSGYGKSNWTGSSAPNSSFKW